MGFFDKILGKKERQIRSPLVHPKDLTVGDIVKFGFLSQSDLSNKRFEVAQINTYDFASEVSTSFTLKGESGNNIWLSAVNDDGEEYISISKKLSRKHVKLLFDKSEFAKIFEEGAGIELTRKEIPEGLDNWISEHYTETEDCSKGYYHKGDYRDKELPKYEDDGDSLEFYLLEDDEEDFAIEIEVYEGGETEVSVAVYLELSSIDEMWPGQ